eukprot:g13941.t1
MGSWPAAFPVGNEPDAVCHVNERGADDGFAVATVLVDARGRSAANTTGDLVGTKTLQFLHSDVSLYGLPEFISLGLAQVRELAPILESGAVPVTNYGSVYPALGYYWQLMAIALSDPGTPTLFQKLTESAEVVDMAEDVCGLQKTEIAAVAKKTDWGLDVGKKTALTKEMILSVGWFIGYMVALGAVANPKKVCNVMANPQKECAKLPGIVAKGTIDGLEKAAEIIGGPFTLVSAPSQAEIQEVMDDLEKNLMGPVDTPAKSVAQKWGCFWARLRIADAFNLWMNLTPPTSGTGSAKKFLTEATPIKNPLAAVNPFTLDNDQT